MGWRPLHIATQAGFRRYLKCEMSGSKGNPRSPAARFPKHWGVWATLAVALLFSVAIRYRLREMPLERDEGEYAYAGQLMLQGIAPYTLAYTMKLPGTPSAYAALMAVFGQTMAGIRIGLI